MALDTAMRDLLIAGGVPAPLAVLQASGQLVSRSGTGFRSIISGGGGNVDANELMSLFGAQNSLLQTVPVGARVGGIGIPEAIGSVIDVLGSVLGGGSLMQQNGTAAPKAGLITGACPPGMRRKTVSLGRDICVRKPRMNVLNPKALRKATSRISGFHKFAVSAEKQMAAAFRKGGFRARTTSSSSGRCGTCRKSKCSCG